MSYYGVLSLEFKLIDSNGESTGLGLFLASELENLVHRLFMFTFSDLLFLNFFLYNVQPNKNHF